MSNQNTNGLPHPKHCGHTKGHHALPTFIYMDSFVHTHIKHCVQTQHYTGHTGHTRTEEHTGTPGPKGHTDTPGPRVKPAHRAQNYRSSIGPPHLNTNAPCLVSTYKKLCTAKKYCTAKNYCTATNKHIKLNTCN